MSKGKRCSISLFFLVFYVGLAAVSHAGVQTGSFTIVTFNAEWLFDGVDDRMAPWKSPTEAEEHLKRVFQVLDGIDADFISLEEVENLRMLNRLASLFGDDVYRPIFVQGRDTATRQNVGALTKYLPLNYGRTDIRVVYPIPNSRLTCRAGDKGVSKNYWADLDLDGIPVTIIGVHFLAFPDRCDRAVKREAQAAVIRELAEKALKRGREVIILGDMNDFDGTVLDASSDRPISIVLKTLKDVDPALPGDELRNVCDRIPQAERYTAWYDRNRNHYYDPGDELSQIDFILVSKGLYDRIVDVRIDHSYRAGWASDHWLVVITFVYGENLAWAKP